MLDPMYKLRCSALDLVDCILKFQHERMLPIYPECCVKTLDVLLNRTGKSIVYGLFIVIDRIKIGIITAQMIVYIDQYTILTMLINKLLYQLIHMDMEHMSIQMAFFAITGIGPLRSVQENQFCMLWHAVSDCSQILHKYIIRKSSDRLKLSRKFREFLNDLLSGWTILDISIYDSHPVFLDCIVRSILSEGDQKIVICFVSVHAETVVGQHTENNKIIFAGEDFRPKVFFVDERNRFDQFFLCFSISTVSKQDLACMIDRFNIHAFFLLADIGKLCIKEIICRKKRKDLRNITGPFIRIL